MSLRRTRGFLLPLAVFLLLMLSVVGAYLVTVSVNQAETVAQDQRGALAYQAARAGAEWGAYQILRNPAGAFATACAGGPVTQTLTLAGSLAGYFAQVRCEASAAETEGAGTVRAYQLVSTGCSQNPCASGPPGDPAYVERQVQLTITN